MGAPGADYFSTGTMVIIPSSRIFDDLVNEYKYGSFNYNQWRARDGILCRNYFKKRHAQIDGSFFSSMYHFHGYFKPWFNVKNPPPRSEKRPYTGPEYKNWWKLYQDIHDELFSRMWNGVKGSYGIVKKQPYDDVDNKDKTPSTHLWVMRHSRFNYTQEIPEDERDDAFEPLPNGVVLVTAKKPGLSCDQVCKTDKQHPNCHRQGLLLPTINSCTTLRKQFGGGLECKSCAFSAQQPAYPAVGGKVCFISTLVSDSPDLPTCEATSPSLKRLCACASQS
eukprot:TRINITY_DN93942_c0_g1_i1.p1 TRINITY_DN93942_c0_g1~~TRINITY_DN93942_c0_g1_i1.p1  ORF type:complete len:308 (-),score=30.75 TRINITY_DN93942_c0_g1_i1:70-906(-)